MDMNNRIEFFEKNEEKGGVGGGSDEEECERCSWWLEGVSSGVAATVFYQRFKCHTSMLLKDSTFQTLTLHALNLALSRVWKGMKIPFKDIIDIILTVYAGKFPYLKAAYLVAICLVLLPITILEFVSDLVWMMLVKVGSKFSHLPKSSIQKEEEEKREQDKQLIGVELGDVLPGVNQAYPQSGLEQGYPLPGVKQACPPSGVELGYPLPGVKQACPPSEVELEYPLPGVKQACPTSGVELGYPPPSLNDPVAAAKDLWVNKDIRTSHYTPESYIYGECTDDSVEQSQMSQSCPILDLILPSIPSSPPGQIVEEVLCQLDLHCNKNYSY